MLHPFPTFLFLVLIFGSFFEVNREKKNLLLLWLVGILMVLVGGFRVWVGADYPVYYRMYFEFSTLTSQDVWDKLLFRESKIEIEGGYILFNRILYFMGAPFWFFTVMVSIVLTILRLSVYYRNSPYPLFSAMLFLIPVYFTSDNGQMRQALAMAFCLLSYEFIKRRQFWYFLLVMYFALIFHKSAVFFIPAYWLVKIPLNRLSIVLLIAISVALSPLKIFNIAPELIESMAPSDVAMGYTGYVELEDKPSTFMDVMMLMYATFVVTYDKQACSKVWYYEYVRNILVFGVCFYFIFRSNPAFATRLVGMYSGFSAIVIPSIVYSMSGAQKKMGHLYFVIFMIFYYFVFVAFQGAKTSWLPGMYRNVLFGD